jgi:hypothetical protein
MMLNKIFTWTAKTRAIPSLHRDYFLAKVSGPCPVLSSDNTTSLYCRAVSSNNLDINAMKNSTYRFAPTLLAYCNSRFCILKFTKPAHERNLHAPSLLQTLNLL